MAKLTVLHEGKDYQIKSGAELLQAFRSNPSFPLKFGCTQGDCALCAIQVVEGEENLSKKTKIEINTLAKKNLTPSHRLACQCAILGDVTIL